MLKFAILILALLGVSVYAVDFKCQVPSPTKDDFCGYTYDAKMCGVSAFDPNLLCSETSYNSLKNVCPKIPLSKEAYCEKTCKPLSEIPDVCNEDSDCEFDTPSATKTPKPTKTISIQKPCYCVCMACYDDKAQCDNMVAAGAFDSDNEDCYKFYSFYTEDDFAETCSESRETASKSPKTSKVSKTTKQATKTAEPEESETNDASESASESEAPETSEATETETETATASPTNTPSRRPSSRSRPASRSPARRPSSRSSRTPSVDGSVSSATTIQISFVILAIIAFFF